MMRILLPLIALLLSSVAFAGKRAEVYPQTKDPICYAYGESLQVPYIVEIRADTVFVNDLPFWPIRGSFPKSSKPTETGPPSPIVLQMEEIDREARCMVAEADCATLADTVLVWLKAYQAHPAIDSAWIPEGYKTSFKYTLRDQPLSMPLNAVFVPHTTRPTREENLERHFNWVCRCLREDGVAFGFYQKRPYCIGIGGHERARQGIARVHAGADSCSIESWATSAMRKFYQDIRVHAEARGEQ